MLSATEDRLAKASDTEVLFPAQTLYVRVDRLSLTAARQSMHQPHGAFGEFIARRHKVSLCF